MEGVGPVTFSPMLPAPYKLDGESTNGGSMRYLSLRTMRLGTISLTLALLSLFTVTRASAQTGTPHGVFITFNASTSSVAGYNIYQCPGTCTPTVGVWTKVDATLDLTTSYQVPLTGLVAGATYSYATTAVDASGNESIFSNIATVSLPTPLPVNPNSPTNTTAAVH
jgi:hypothetical protein